MPTQNNRCSLHFSGRQRLLALLLVMAALMLSAGVSGTASTESSNTWQQLSKISIRGSGSVAPVMAGVAQGAGGCTTPQFAQAPGSPFGTGDSPRQVAIGDFNRDGKQDLAVANYLSNNVTIRLGNGAGVFPNAKASTVGAGTNPTSVAIGDFNNDGKQDLAVANAGSDNVTIRLGNGAGKFPDANATTVGAGHRPSSVAIGDFNRDGKQDLAVANFQDLSLVNSGFYNVTIRLGNGAGGFPDALASTFSVGNNSASLVIGDFNRDDKQDLAIVNFGSSLVNLCDQCVSIRLGSGAGGFPDARASTASTGNRPISLAVGDFNLDGKQDLAVVNSGSNNVTIRLGNGAGGFPDAKASTVGVGFEPNSVAVGDFNRDGKPDLAVTNSGSDNVTIRLGDGAGGFPDTKDSTVGAGDEPNFVAVGDFNRDGKPDLAVTNRHSDNITIQLNTCAPFRAQ